MSEQGTENTLADQQQLIVDCLARASLLDDWERDFLRNLTRTTNRGKRLSVDQLATLDKLWDRVTANG